MGRSRLPFAANDKTEASFVVTCASHGSMPWEGDIVCARCGSLHDLDTAPDVCLCGASLMPSADKDSFSARLVCPSCAHARRS